MLASALTLAILFVLFIPGVFLAHKNQSLNGKFLMKCLVLNFSLFVLLGLIFKALPWFIDPRFKL